MNARHSGVYLGGLWTLCLGLAFGTLCSAADERNAGPSSHRQTTLQRLEAMDRALSGTAPGAPHRAPSAARLTIPVSPAPLPIGWWPLFGLGSLSLLSAGWLFIRRRQGWKRRTRDVVHLAGVLQQELNQANDHRRALERAVAQQETRAKELEQEREHVKQRAEELGAKLAHTHDALTQHQRQLRDAEEAAARAQRSAQQAKTAADQHQQRSRHLEEALHDTAEQLRAQEETTKNLNWQLNEATQQSTAAQARTEQLAAELDVLNAKAASIQEELTHVEAQRTHAVTQCEQLGRELAGLCLQVAELENTRQAMERLQQEQRAEQEREELIAPLQARLEEALRQLNSAQMDLDSARAQRDEANWYLGELRSGEAHRALQQQHEADERALQDAQAHRQRMEADAASQQERLAQLQERLQAAGKERDEANWYLGETRVLCEQLKTDVDAQRTTCQQLREQLQRIESAAKDTGQPWWSGEEHRREPRVRWQEPAIKCRMQAADGSWVLGTIKDAGLRGLRVMLPFKKLLQETFGIRLTIPGQASPAEATARTVWKRDGLRGRGELGLALDGLNTADQDTLRAFLQNR